MADTSHKYKRDVRLSNPKSEIRNPKFLGGLILLLLTVVVGCNPPSQLGGTGGPKLLPLTQPARGLAAASELFADRTPTTLPTGNISEAICDAALAWLDSADRRIDAVLPAAEAAAERFMAGGTLWVAGNGGFCDEYDYRAGGFPFARLWRGEKLGDHDVLLVGHFRDNHGERPDALLKRMAAGDGPFAKGMVVYLASREWAGVDLAEQAMSPKAWAGRFWLIDTGAPSGASWEALTVGQLSAAALGWAFHGETVAAATRKGKMLATFASDWEPFGQAWDASVRPLHVHPKYQVPAMAAGRIGRQYVAICRGFVSEFRQGQLALVRLGAQRMAAALRAGHDVWAVSDGHIHVRGSLVPAALPRLRVGGRSFVWGPWRMSAGDVMLHMAYLRYPRAYIESALRMGGDVVIVSVDPGPTNQRITTIRGCWKDFDTVIDLPNYPIRILASSGVVQTPQWYCLVAETLAARGPAR